MKITQPQDRNHVLSIISITASFIGCELVTQRLFPHITTGQSQVVSIAIVVVLATLASVGFRYWPCRSAPIVPGAARGERRRQENYVRALIQHATDVIAIVDPSGTIHYVSPAVERILGYMESELVGTSLFERIHPDDRPVAQGAFVALLQISGPGSGVELRARHRDSSWRPLEAISNNLLGDPRINGIVVTARDIGARQRAETALRWQATHDALTGLPNRFAFQERLGQALQQDEAVQPRPAFALLRLDLDRFKETNDTLGHHISDALLQEIGRRLQASLRPSEVVTRLGGDEFAFVLPATAAAEAREIAAAVIRAIEAPVAIEEHSLYTSASIGIALYPHHGGDAETLLRHADSAMYTAKRAHAGVALYDSAVDRHDASRRALLIELRQAIAYDTLTLLYQPIGTLPSGQIVGVEALVRWTHPAHGPIPPDRFIPLAEQSGLVGLLTAWVLEAALRQCAAWARSGSYPIVQVNLSMRDVQDPQLPNTVATLLDKYAVAPTQLTLEITENTLMIDPARVQEVLTRLGVLGVRLAIDDFGTGYSSLRYLKELPVTEVKIDQSFVRDMETHAADAAIVHSVMLVMEATTPIEQAIRQATGRPQDERYDPLIVVDAERYIGMVTVSRLLDHLNDAAVFQARLSNPRTGLPGAPVVEAEINARLGRQASFSLVYAHLNDATVDTLASGQGAILNDEAMQAAARAAREVVAEMGADDLVGQVGDGDVVIVCATQQAEHRAARLAARFTIVLPPHRGADTVMHTWPPSGAAHLQIAVIASDEVAAPSYLSLLQAARHRIRRLARDLPERGSDTLVATVSASVA